MRPRRCVARLRDAVVLIVTASLVLNFESPASTASPQKSPSLPPAGSVTYSYDASGRLVGASEPGVGSVTHSYDAAGNLTATTPSTGTDPQLTSVTPQHAPPGSTVTLRGANFSSTASNDQVSFGGSAATVSSAAAGSLTVTVPSAATSGPVTVTVGGVTATGPGFTVDPSPQAPTISGFSAAQVILGATVTINGSHFDPNPARNVVQINQTRAVVTTASATSLTVTVPQAGIGSGKVSVSTPAGVATSPADLYVLPAVLAASTFDSGQRITPPATVTLATAGSGHVALATFDAPANGRLFVREGTSSVPSCNGTLTVYDPHGVAIGSDSCVWTKDYLDDLPLRTAGTYTVALSTNGSGGSIPVTLDLVPADSTAAISTDGTPTTITTSVGQSAKLTFTGTAGQRVFVKITGNTAEASSCVALALVAPDGSTVVTGSGCSASSYIDTTTLPTTGGYSLTFNPGGTDAGSATMAVYTVAADSSAAVTTDGSATTVTTSIGQSASLTFTGTAGQRVFVKISGISASARAASCPTISLVGPSGSNVASKMTCSANDYFDTTTLPVDGTYTFVFNPGSTDAGSATIAVYTVAADSSAGVNADGTATTVTTSIGQSAMLTFTGAAGQRVFVNFTGISASARAASCPTISLVGPSGSNVASKMTCSANDYFDTTSLPSAGTYTVVFNPNGPDTGSATVAVYTVAADSSAGVNADGTATTVTTSIGQSAMLTFTGAASQRVFVNFTGISASARVASCPTISLVGPSGSNVASKMTCSANDYFDTTSLPSAGTYTVVFNPNGPDTGSATIAVSTVAADSSAAVNADGTATTVSTSIGQSANLTFSGTAGQRVFVNFTGISASARVASCPTISLVGPSGSNVASKMTCSANDYFDTTSLPSAGTYTVVFNPNGPDTGSATIAVSTVPADSSTPTTIGGAAVTVTVTVGQNAKLTFTGTAGQKVNIAITGNTAGATNCDLVTLTSPTGSTVSNNYDCSASYSSGTLSLPSAGTYTLTFNPIGADSGSATIAISAVTSLAAPLRATASTGASTAVTPARRTAPVRAALDDRWRPDLTATSKPAGKAATPAHPATNAGTPRWISSAASSRDAWLPSRSNLAGTDWLSHRTPAPAASLPPLAAPPGVTALAGQVLTVGGTPLPGVTLSADGHSARSDSTGRFLLTGISAGQRVLLIDGGTASTSHRRFGIFQVSVHVLAGRTVPLGYPIWLTKLDLAHASAIPSPTIRRTVLTTPEIPGFEVVLPAGTVVRDLQGHIVRQISITPVPTDRPPFPLPAGVVTPAYFTVQPGGSYIFPQGAQIIYPNSLHARPGSRVQFYNYDPAGRGWYIYGGGNVSADGKQVVPDPGVKVWSFTGAMINIPGLNLPAIGQAIGNALAALAAADPVDPGTGLFSFSQTDLAEPDTLPITLTRSYRQLDTNQFAFGQGFNWTYGMYQWSAQQYQQSDLVFPNGSHIHFIRTSPGTGWSDAVFKATNGWGDFANAVMKWNGLGWDVTGHTGLTYVFGENQPLQSIRDRYGNQLTISRVGGGQSGDITQVTSPHGLWIRLAYNSSHRVTQAADNAGRTVSYSYDTSGRLSQVTNATSGTTSYTWDSSNRLLTVTDALNHTIARNTYDSNSRVASQQIGTGGTYTFGYTTDSNNRVTQTDVTDPDGHVIRYTFNADGVVTGKTLAPGTSSAETWSYTLAPTTDYLSSVTDPLGHQTSYSYDSNGNVTSKTLLAGTASARTTTYDTSGPYGQVVSVTDPLSHRTSFGYDAKGSLASVTNPASQVISYTYAADGQLASVANTTSDKVTESYNVLGQLVSSSDPLNRVTRYWSDAASRPVLTTAADGGQTITSYDNGNHVTQVVDAVGRQTGYAYNSDGQLVTVTDANTHTTSYSYDVDGRPTGWTQAGGASLTRSYDPAGNLASITDGRGKTSTISYDVLNRPSVVRYGVSGGTASSSVSYAYDAVNRVTSLQDSVAGTTSIGYDDLGEPTTVTTPQGSIGYSYDVAGRRTGMTVAGGTPISYGYTAADALASVSQGSTSVSYAYDTNGRLTSLALPGASQGYTFDAAGQLGSINYTSGSTTLGSLSYSYDPVGRVVGESGSWARLALPAAMTASYNAANEASTVNGVAQSYDGAGNLTSDGTNSYSWNDRGQLAGVTGPAVGESYGYGSSGLRTSVTSGASSTSYLWDLSGNQVAELTGGSVSATELTGLGVDRTLVRTDANGSRSQLTDRLGSVVATTDANGTVMSQFGYTPFGEQAGSGESIPGAPAFTGRTASSATGLQYNRDRYYNPVLGRFISQDPIGQSGGLNTYAYAGGDPVNFVDPSGDAAVLAAALAGAALGLGLGLGLGLALGLALGMDGLAIAAGAAAIDIGAAAALTEALAAGGAVAGAAVGAGQALAMKAADGSEPGGSTQGANETGGSNPFRGTNMSDEESLNYHYEKHGDGRTLEQYIRDAQNFADNPTGTAQDVTLRDGTTGVRYRTPGGPGGILDSDGNVITFWYK